MDMAPDRYRFVLGGPIVMEPGKRWVYNGGATAVLARIIEKGSGKPLHEFARETLFDPLGIGPTEWLTDRNDEAIAASGLCMTPRDLARIGVMTLKGGMWGERWIVPAEWVERSTSPMVDVDEIRQYGYQLVPGQIRIHCHDGAALEPLAARALLERDRQWRPTAVCASRPRSGRGYNRRQL
jgi:CubicO group peptidase (beta-lactamase class C family)